MHPTRADDLPTMMTTLEVALVGKMQPKSLRNAVYARRHIGRYAVRVGRRLLWRRDVVLRWLRGELDSGEGATTVTAGQTGEESPGPDEGAEEHHD